MADLVAAILMSSVFWGTHPMLEKVYQVRYVPKVPIQVDGHLDEPAWRAAVVEQGFRFPWKAAEAPSTRFRALADDETLYFAFEADDRDIVLVEDFRSKEDVVKEDRVEMFFALDEGLKSYYCLEIDPRARTLDYKASYYRQFDNAWSCAGLKVAAQITARGYTVEGALRLETFHRLGLPPLGEGQAWRVGLFRAEFSHGPGAAPIEDWISWVDPRTSKPDFHVPSAFGLFRLVK